MEESCVMNPPRKSLYSDGTTTTKQRQLYLEAKNRRSSPSTFSKKHPTTFPPATTHKGGVYFTKLTCQSASLRVSFVQSLYVKPIISAVAIICGIIGSGGKLSQTGEQAARQRHSPITSVTLMSSWNIWSCQDGGGTEKSNDCRRFLMSLTHKAALLSLRLQLIKTQSFAFVLGRCLVLQLCLIQSLVNVTY